MGRIQNADIKSLSEVGNNGPKLPNDTKIWITANSIAKTLYQAIVDGDLSGGGGGGAAGIDMLIQKNDNERSGKVTTPLDTSIGVSGQVPQPGEFIEGNLLSDFTSGGSTLDVVWNGVAVNASDKNYDSTTGWTATSAATTLTTSATKKIGTASLSFNKAGTGTEAGIRYDQGSQNFSVGTQWRAWYWINLPSITNLTDVYLKIYADTTSNFRKWTKTTNYAGSALTTGWNLIFVDISSNTGSTTGGTGWTYTTLSRYQEVGVDATSGQTYTAVLIDSLYFSYGDIAKFYAIGNQFSVFDTTNVFESIVDSANTLHDGTLTLSASIGSNISGGLSGAARGRIKRSGAITNGPGNVSMNNDASFGGSITTTQFLRTQTTLRESISKDYMLYVDQFATQRYAVTAVGGSTIDVSDPGDTHLNLLNGDTMDIFRPQYVAGKITYSFVKTIALTANSTASSGTTTLTLTTSSILVGDIVVKRLVTEVALSTVATTANENFIAQTLDSDPNGKILIGEAIYPYPDKVWGHWTLGDINSSEATRNRLGPGPSLSTIGTLVYNEAFKNGRYGVSGFATNSTLVNYLDISTSRAQEMSGESADGSAQISIWFYDTSGFTGTIRPIVTCLDSTGTNGWYFRLSSGSNTIQFLIDNTASSTAAYNTGQWNHVVFQPGDSGGNSFLYLNGALAITATGSNMAATTRTHFSVGANFPSQITAVGVRLADLITWRSSTALSQAYISYLYNNGNAIDLLNPSFLRLRYTAAGQTGQKISMRAKLQRSTTAVTPIIFGEGLIGS